MLFRRCAPLLVVPLVFVACSSSENQDGASASATASSSSDATSTATDEAPGSTSSDPPGSTSGDDGATTAPTTGATTTASTSPTTGESTTTDEPASTSSSTGEGATCDLPGVFDCCCFNVAGDAGHEILSISCTDPGKLCEAPQATCPEGQTDCALGELTVTSVEGLECVLQALADGTPGAVSWGVTSENGLNGANNTMFIQKDGTVIASGYEYKETAYTYSAVDRRAKQDAAFFTDCIAKPVSYTHLTLPTNREV